MIARDILGCDARDYARDNGNTQMGEALERTRAADRTNLPIAEEYALDLFP